MPILPLAKLRLTQWKSLWKIDSLSTVARTTFLPSVFHGSNCIQILPQFTFISQFTRLIQIHVSAEQKTTIVHSFICGTRNFYSVIIVIRKVCRNLHILKGVT